MVLNIKDYRVLTAANRIWYTIIRFSVTGGPSQSVSFLWLRKFGVTA